MQFNQTNNNVGDVNNYIQIMREAIGDHSLAELAVELKAVRESMVRKSTGAEQDKAIAAIASAEEAASKGDANGVVTKLKAAGKWALDAATAIGTPLVIKALEKALEL